MTALLLGQWSFLTTTRMFRLACGKNPKTLGIEDAGGSWDMVRFGDHVQSCATCSSFVGHISRYLAGKGGRAGKRELTTADARKMAAASAKKRGKRGEG